MGFGLQFGKKPVGRGSLQPVRSALLPLLLMAAAPVAVPLSAAELSPTDSVTRAAAAFARYTAVQQNATPWRQETIQIDASLPKLAEKGRLRAIRRLLPIGRPEYQVLEIAGDRTVKQQVIVRYLNEDVRTATLPPSSVAITSANYKFRYKGSVQTASGAAYIFSIDPRKKREGLIRGELWLDGTTGLAVRQSGYFVKKPSIFVKRMAVVRETEIRDGVAEVRITHLSIDTRLVGTAELTIEERPFDASDPGRAVGGSEQ
jgi:hypothetical protein